MSGLPVLYGRNIEVTPPGSGITIDGVLVKDGQAGAVRANFSSESKVSSASMPILLNKDSPQDQYVTGSDNQTVIMPHSSSLSSGMVYRIHNRSSGIITVSPNVPADCTVATMVTLPAATLDVTTTTGFSASGTIYVESDAGVQTVTYTGTTLTTFTGCSGGIGTSIIGSQVSQTTGVLTNIPELPKDGFSQHICSNPSSGTWKTYLFAAPVLDSNATVVYNDTLDDGIFYGLNTRENSADSTCVTMGQNAVTGGSNQIAMGTNASTKGATANITVLSHGDVLPQAIINVNDTTGFLRGAETTIAAASDGLSLPQSTINAVSTFYFPTSGAIYVDTDMGLQLVTHTSKSGSAFTGCTGGVGVMATGNVIHMDTKVQIDTADAGIQEVNYASLTGNAFVNCFGGTGTLATSGNIFQPTTGTSHIALGHNTVVTGSSTIYDYSAVAIGRDARAYGDDRGGSVAIGVQADAQRQAATAVGTNSYAGEYCVALGSGNSGPGSGANATLFSNAVGYQATAADYSAAIGTSSFAAIESVSLGYEAMAMTESVAEGFRASAMNESVAIGANSTADNQSVGLGAFTRAVINRSLCMGSRTTEISAISNGVSLPVHTIYVDSTTAFSDAGMLLVTNSSGITQTITYTGPNTATSFVGCSGGSGVLATDGLVAQYTEALDDEHALAISINSDTVGTYWLRMNGKQLEAYPTMLESESLSVDPVFLTEKDLPKYHVFSGVGSSEQIVLLPPSNVVSEGHQVFYLNNSNEKIRLNSTTGTWLSVPTAITLPAATIYVDDTSMFASSGTLYINGDSAVQTITYSGTTNNETTIDVPSDAMVLPQAIINVVSTAGFPTSGTILVNTNTGVEQIAYTNITATTFTGCTGGTGTMSTGGAVTHISFTGCTGGTGPVTLNNLSGKGLLYQIQNEVGVVLPNTQIDLVCADVSGNTVIDGWDLETENTTVDFSIIGLPDPNNYSANVLGVDVNELYRTDQNGTTNLLSTTIAAGSNGMTLPQTTINVASTTDFSPSGSAFVTTSAGKELVSYTGLTSTTLEGCTGGTGIMTTGGAITQNGGIAITSMLDGNMLTITSASDAIISSGMFLTGGGVLAGTQILTGSGGAGAYTVDVSQTTSVTTTIDTGSDMVSLPVGNIEVLSTADFFPSGSILVETTIGEELVTYTGPNTATSFEGCSGGTGVMMIGNIISQIITPTEVVYSLTDPDRLYVRTV